MTKSDKPSVEELLSELKKAQSTIAKLSQALDAKEESIENEVLADELGESPDERDKVIEGVFDGQSMVGPEGKIYPVPANYASKSKLIEGDILKLMITPDGTFIYKQIGPIERKKCIGRLVIDNGQYRAEVGERSYKLLFASITYFKAKPGDELALVVPKDNEDSNWAAVEAVIS